MGYSCTSVLREPSLGPVFGIKGGATGGGMAKILPEEEINLHFTGDIHAVTTANNLLSAIIDNHIFQGNELQIDPKSITHERCLDLNDRSLRSIEIHGCATRFNISTASEMMAILGLAKNYEDLKYRVGNILVGYTFSGKEVFARDLKCINALALVLKNAIFPNVVVTLEGNLSLVHGGPFANIAHGTASVVALNYAMQHFSYTIVEAGFGSDMGGIKFFDILARTYPEFTPDIVVLNTTIQSLKHNGEGDLKKGMSNLDYHIDTMLKYSKNLVVVLNKHEQDSLEDILDIEQHVEARGLIFSSSEGYLRGSEGSLDAVQKIVNLECKDKQDFTCSYNLKDPLEDKIKNFCKENYGAKEILFSEKALHALEKISHSQFLDLPICIAKTQYSITDNPKMLGYPKNFTMTVNDIKLFSGAGFITVYFGSILTMPGLSKDANYLHM